MPVGSPQAVISYKSRRFPDNILMSQFDFRAHHILSAFYPVTGIFGDCCVLILTMFWIISASR